MVDTAIPLLVEALRKTWAHYNKQDKPASCRVCLGLAPGYFANGFGHRGDCIVLQCDWWPAFVAAHPEWA